MKLQLALDLVDLSTAAWLAKELNGIVDIIEIGTPLVLKEGIRSISRVKEANPEIAVLADFKIMDAGDHEAGLAFDAGADIVTVLGAAGDATIVSCVQKAKEYGRKVMADLISVKDLVSRAQKIEELEVDYICVHTGVDDQANGENPLDELRQLRPYIRRAELAVAGGVRLETVRSIVAKGADIIIAGGSITNQTDMIGAAKQMKRLMLKEITAHG